MKLTLIQPPALMAVDNYSTITQPPLGIAYIAAYVKQKGHDVHVVDAVGEAIQQIHPWPLRKKRLIQGLTFDEIVARIPEDSDVIGVSCMFTHAWPMIRELLLLLKKSFPGARLITGGEHATAMYKTVLSEVSLDACVMGEGEETIAGLLDALKSDVTDLSKVGGISFMTSAGEIIKTEARPRIRETDKLPWPAWDAINIKNYMDNGIYQGPKIGRSMPMLATRGCPYDCTFCAAPSMWTRAWRAREPKKVVDEMQYYMKTYGATDFQFQDLTAIVRKDWIVTFCNEIMSRKLKLTWQLPVGTRSEAIDLEVSQLLVASGCHEITYAPETGSDDMLKSIRKRVNLERLESSVRGAMKAGMKVCLFMIVGFPQETMKDVKKTMKWLRHMAQIGVDEASISTFVPLPNTELFRETNEIKKAHGLPVISVDDEYCYWMTSCTSLTTIRSWNPNFSDKKLIFLKFWTIFQFYSISFLCHPDRIWKRVKYAVQGKQEIKMDRVIQEFLIKIPLWLGVRKPVTQHATKSTH
jgi:anaerobic magnesium-protoporphyrin IX monomethyl ester cyclase